MTEQQLPRHETESAVRRIETILQDSQYIDLSETIIDFLDHPDPDTVRGVFSKFGHDPRNDGWACTLFGGCFFCVKHNPTPGPVSPA